MSHECKFTRTSWVSSTALVHDNWETVERFKEKTCRVDGCEQVQGSRAGTPRIEYRETRFVGAHIASTQAGVEAARILLKWYASRTSSLASWQFLSQHWNKTGGTGEELLEALKDLASQGWLVLRYKPPLFVAKNMLGATVTDLDALEEYVAPGAKAGVHNAIQGIPDVPETRVLREWLQENTSSLSSEEQVRALQGYALHADLDAGLGIRALSALATGDSKLLQRHQSLVKRVYPDSEDRFRDTSLEWFGGHGTIQGIELNGFIRALPQRDLQDLRVDYPANGVVIVENKECFEVASQGLIPSLSDSLVLWSGGQPSHVTHAIARNAAQQGVRVRAWMDLDGEGIGMVRGLRKNGAVEAFHMTASDFEGASVKKVLEGQKLVTAKRELEKDDEFTKALAVMIESLSWVEQETQLPHLFSS